MALRDQPYIPLFIQDYMTDEKLNECSASTQGIFVKIMCLMHKSDNYGKILLKQKNKQHESTSLNYANQLVNHLTFSLQEIDSAINELLDEGVLYTEGEYICQKRMIRDNELSMKRSSAGRKGGKKTQFAKSKEEANNQANSEYEYEYEYSNNKGVENFKKPVQQEKVVSNEKLAVPKEKVTSLQKLTTQFFGLEQITNARGYMDMCNFIKQTAVNEEGFNYLIEQTHFYTKLVEGGRMPCAARSWIEEKWNAQSYKALWKQQNNKQFGQKEETPRKIKA